MAQVTLSGTLAAGYDTWKNSSNVTQKVYGFQTSTVRLTASEDLGGGLRATAVWNIEQGGNTNRNNDTRSGDRSLSLAGGFGTIAFESTRATNLAVGGNVASISLQNDQYSDLHTVFETGSRRNVALISYTSPELAPGLRVGFARAMNETTSVIATAAMSDAQKGAQNSIGVTYRSGPLAAAVVFKNNNATLAPAPAKKNVTEANASYDFGVARVGVGYAGKRTDTDKTAMTFGISAPLASNITVGLNYGKRDKARYTDIGATYALSKRTSVSIANGQYKNNTAGAKTNSQTRVRVAHNF